MPIDHQLGEPGMEDEAPPPLSGPPSSPSNSWSSADTAPIGADSPQRADGEARRPKRCKISREQLAVLISSFEEEPLPNFDQRQALAKALGMTPRSVQIWFQNRRQRLKPVQPKASGSLMGGSGRGGRAGASGQTPQQQLGMPGLLAAAASTSSLESLVMGHQYLAGAGQYQHPQQVAGLPSYGSSGNLSSYDVMEPFAATKALLGAGYNPSATSLATQLGSHSPSPPQASGLPGVDPTPSTREACGSPATPSAFVAAPPAAAVAAPEPKADGLLLLLGAAGC